MPFDGQLCGRLAGLRNWSAVAAAPGSLLGDKVKSLKNCAALRLARAGPTRKSSITCDWRAGGRAGEDYALRVRARRAASSHVGPGAPLKPARRLGVGVASGQSGSPGRRESNLMNLPPVRPQWRANWPPDRWPRAPPNPANWLAAADSRRGKASSGPLCRASGPNPAQTLQLNWLLIRRTSLTVLYTFTSELDRVKRQAKDGQESSWAPFESIGAAAPAACKLRPIRLSGRPRDGASGRGSHRALLAAQIARLRERDR